MLQSNTPGGVGVYLMAAVFQTIIKLVERWMTSNFPSTVCINMFHLYPLRLTLSVLLKLFSKMYLLNQSPSELVALTRGLSVDEVKTV